uniref:Uncharacterized protein n=1 Tax=Octactis speculum TaxID=3111310 RepID=A0A7S2E2V8_9STRA
MEHDVGITGNDWRALFDAHLARDHPPQEGGGDTDLLSWLVGWAPIPPPHPHEAAGWTLGVQQNSRFGELHNVPIPNLAVHFGPVIRVSSRLMDHMHVSALEGYLGHFEIAPTTLCNQTRWCTIGNLSRARVGVIAYRAPVDLVDLVMDSLSTLAPGRLFHPARETSSVSSKGVAAFSGKTTHGSAKAVETDPRKLLRAQHTAMCLLANPRPRRPSWGCLEGCPFHAQWVCPTVNCMANSRNGTYEHLAAGACVRKCQQRPKGCPYDTSIKEWGASNVFQPGDMRKGLWMT